MFALRKLKRVLNFSNVLDKLSTLNFTDYFPFSLGAALLGFLLNLLNPMEYFLVKALLGFMILILLPSALKYFKKKSQQLKFAMTRDPVLFLVRKKFTKRCFSNFNYLAPVSLPIFCCIISVKLSFVQINPVGVYSLVCLFGLVFIAQITLQQNIYLMLLIADLSKKENLTHNRLIPDTTKWFTILIEMTSTAMNYFFILGTLFVALYSMFAPRNTVVIIFKIGLQSSDFWPLLLSWLVIIFAIIILFPVSVIIRRSLFIKILHRMQSNSIEYYSSLIDENIGIRQLIYMDIIGRLNKEPVLPKHGLSRFIPLGTTIVNLFTISWTICVDLQLF